MGDDRNGAAPARVHRAQAGVSETGEGSKTQREAVAGALGVLDTLARDVSGSTTRSAGVDTSVVDAAVTEAPASTPSLAPTPEPPLPVYMRSLPPRADPTLAFFTALLMKDGKKAQAERFTTSALALVANTIHSNPLPLLHAAIGRCAPLVKLISKKQGGKTIQVPTPLTPRQSTRKALVWIIEASKKRSDRKIERRLAAELLAVTDGTSAAIQKKEEQHRMATVNRANAAVRI
jgi:small subunit ribosomal protein S7